jgi:hypothetical protein
LSQAKYVDCLSRSSLKCKLIQAQVKFQA